MIRGVAVALFAFGIAWTLAGSAAVSGKLSIQTELEEQYKTELEETNASIKEATKSLVEASAEVDEQIAEAKTTIKTKKAELEKMGDKFEAQQADLEDKREAAEFDLNDRKLRRAEAALANIGDLESELKQAEAKKTVLIESHAKQLTALKTENDLSKPGLATALGVLLLLVGGGMFVHRGSAVGQNRFLQEEIHARRQQPQRMTAQARMVTPIVRGPRANSDRHTLHESPLPQSGHVETMADIAPLPPSAYSDSQTIEPHSPV
jgi:DNA repair exonuclease SbcCD ATPase subunit